MSSEAITEEEFEEMFACVVDAVIAGDGDCAVTASELALEGATLATSAGGLVVTLADGVEFQITIVQSKAAAR